MRTFLFVSSILVLFLSGCVKPVKQVEIKQAIQVTDKTKVKPIAITKVAAKIRRGTEIGEQGIGLACLNNGKIKWRSGGTVNLSSEDLVDVFREELESNGWPVVGSTDDLFSGYDISGAEVLVAAKLTALKTSVCFPWAGFGNFTSSKGSMRVDVEWQVYSPARKELIGMVSTQGSAQIEDTTDDAAYELLNNSFSLAANNLLASKEFMEMVAKSSGLKAPINTAALSSINNKKTSYKSLEEAIAAAKKSTVTIRTASGHGSGFVVGDGDMIITNSHVVGNAKTVTLVTNGGISINGNVSRVSKGRDVALITVTGLRLPSLHIEPKEPASTTKVYAIGSPLTEDLKGTVTGGIVSGIREMDGYEWIQSDTAISPGNSGGPLLDENGSVIGISTASFQPNGSQVGLNLFIPIKDAAANLGLRVQ